MFPRKWLLSICIWLGPLLAVGQVYHAAQTDSAPVRTTARWEVSAGVLRTNGAVEDPLGEKFFSGQTGLTARGLYHWNNWLAAGIEGAWFSSKKLGFSGTLRHARYGLITRWALTPQTKPTVYALLGGGMNQRKLSYAGMWSHTKSSAYGLLGVGVEVPVYRGAYLAAEVQGVYNARRTLDDFTRLSRRLETEVMLRGGIRF